MELVLGIVVILVGIASALLFFLAIGIYELYGYIAEIIDNIKNYKMRKDLEKKGYKKRGE